MNPKPLSGRQAGVFFLPFFLVLALLGEVGVDLVRSVYRPVGSLIPHREK